LIPKFHDSCYAGGLTTERKLDPIKIEKVGFEDIAARKGINFLFSSGPDETSGENEESGWYTHYLLKGLQGEANLDGDDYVTLQELSTYVRQKVSQSTQNRQNPMSFIVKGDIKITTDEQKKAEETLSMLTKEVIDGTLAFERFQVYGKILNQSEDEDTQEEAAIRQILMNYNALPSLGIDYVIMSTDEYFEQPPITKQIRIETSPTNAAIYINGQYIGTSPINKELQEGTHTIEAKKDGYKTKTTTKTIGTQTKDMSRIETISLTLERETGSLYVQSSPSGASIYLDGSYKGTTPKTIEGLEVGTYTLKLTKSGYQDKSQTIRIEAGKREDVYLTLEKETGSLYIQSEPSGASIYLDGSYKGTTPKTIEGLEVGTYSLKLSKSNYNDKSQNITIKAGKRETLNLTLEIVDRTPKLQKLSMVDWQGNEKTTFDENDTGVAYAFEFSNWVDAHDISGKWYKPDGSLYHSGSNFTYEARTDGEFKKWIGYEFENKESVLNTMKSNPGKWKVEVYLDDEYLRTVYFTFEKPKVVYTKPEMVLVKGGTFQMGNTRDDSEGDSREKPVHTVKLTYDYYIGKYEVTFKEYDVYCNATGKNKPKDEGWGRDSRPVINVTWYDAIAYCNWISEKEGLAKAYDSNGNLLDKNGRQTTDITKVEGYRLLTEAEWEYAARGGHKSTVDYKYAGSNDINDVALYWKTSNKMTEKVGQKDSNELGLFDMSGNVYEWCYDWYGDYTSTSQTNPTGAENHFRRISRGGGGWNVDAEFCRVANRGLTPPSTSYYDSGFRIARTKK